MYEDIPLDPHACLYCGEDVSEDMFPLHAGGFDSNALMNMREHCGVFPTDNQELRHSRMKGQ